MDESKCTAEAEESRPRAMGMCERQLEPWELLDRMAKHKQREILGAAQDVMELEQLADWLRSQQHKIPPHILPMLLRLVARSDR